MAMNRRQDKRCPHLPLHVVAFPCCAYLLDFDQDWGIPRSGAEKSHTYMVVSKFKLLPWFMHWPGASALCICAIERELTSSASSPPPPSFSHKGLIGEALIDLSPLADGGLVIAEWAAVEDATGRPAGYVSISARWVKPLRTGGDPGPHGLSAEEVEGLMERFSPEKDGLVRS